MFQFPLFSSWKLLFSFTSFPLEEFLFWEIHNLQLNNWLWLFVLLNVPLFNAQTSIQYIINIKLSMSSYNGNYLFRIFIFLIKGEYTGKVSIVQILFTICLIVKELYKPLFFRLIHKPNISFEGFAWDLSNSFPVFQKDVWKDIRSPFLKEGTLPCSLRDFFLLELFSLL